MAIATVELIGGPRDGDHVTVDLSKMEFIVPSISLATALNEAETPPDTILRTARYHQVTGRGGEVAYEYVKGSIS